MDICRVSWSSSRFIRWDFCSESMFICDVIYFSINSMSICKSIRSFFVTIRISFKVTRKKVKMKSANHNELFDWLLMVSAVVEGERNSTWSNRYRVSLFFLDLNGELIEFLSLYFISSLIHLQLFQLIFSFFFVKQSLTCFFLVVVVSIPIIDLVSKIVWLRFFL